MENIARVRERPKFWKSGILTDDEEKEDIVRQQEDNGYNLEVSNTETPSRIKRPRSPRSGCINSKSDSWFVGRQVKMTNNQDKMILSKKNLHNYFSCGDVEKLSKNARRNNFTDEELLKKIKPCQDYENKLKELKMYVQKYPEVADLKINLYITACNKHCLSPYPNYIIEENVIGMESLTLINEFLPPVCLLQQYLKKTKNFTPNEHVINVLHWLLVTFPEPILVKMESNVLTSIIDKVENVKNVEFPTHLFKISHKRLKENLWLAEKEEITSKYAFFPINMDHAHSIIHLGIHPQIYTEGIYGPGIYLSSDLRCCLECAQAQWVWGKSMLGIETQIIMLVEFLNHPDVISYKENNAICKEPCSNIEKGTTFYFIPSHKFVRVRYLMLYVKTPSTLYKEPKKITTKSPLGLQKFTNIVLPISLAILLIAKRKRFSKMAGNVFSAIASIPFIKLCLSVIQEECIKDV